MSKIRKISDFKGITAPLKKDIFIVHGHDNELVQEVARFIKSLDLEPIILHEKPSEGRVLFQKFADYASNASFAVVLLTPDDIGKDKNEDDGKLRHRARQNVIFELGFFCAKLGHKNVASICATGIEIPADYIGVLYIPRGEADWKIKLAKEMKAGGISFDMNKLLDS